jgi:geranylgeranyl pyrophosphate synthase
MTSQTTGTTQTPSATTPLLAPVLDDLVVADAAIRAVADTENPLLSQTLRIILTVSGKRLRPALTLLAAGLHETALQRRVELATAAELLHTATLIHDDVIDASTARRGRPTINAAFNNTLAVLTGDYLFGKSGELISGLGSTAIMGVYSWAVMELVQGEMFRPTLNGDLAATERDYLAKIRGKTASLFAMCTQTGAMLDAEDPAAVARLRDYGLNLGMAFQVVDDVLDYTASEAELGKPVGSDLRHGTITLPAIYYLRQHPQDDRVRGLLAQDDDAQPEADAAVEAVRRSGATEQALDDARAYAAAAAAALDGLPSGPAVESLHGLARYVVDRKE